MITIEVPEKNTFLYFPEELAECDGQQFLHMAKLIFWLNTSLIDSASFSTLAVYALLGLQYEGRKSSTPNFLSEEDLAKYENVYLLSKYVDNFFDRSVGEDGEPKISLKFNFIKNHNPVYKTLGIYYGPDDAFENVTFGQYIDALDEFIDYTNNGNIMALRKLFAILYLPKGEAYDKRKSQQRAEGVFKTLDIRWMYGVYLFFSAVNRYMMSGSVMVFGEEIDLRIIYIDVKKKKNSYKSDIPGLGWISTAQDLAESGVFGNYNEVRNTPMWTIILRLYELKKKAIDEEAMQIQQNTNA